MIGGMGGFTMPHAFRAVAAAAAITIAATTVAAQQVTKDQVPGIRNLSRLETTVACAGATEVDAIPNVKKMGFVAIINLRQASEPGANVPESQAAAKAAGLNYVHIPFDASKPDPAVADRFLEAIRQPANQPAYIHCASANRAAALWLIKRVEIDQWDADRAMKEAEALGLTSAPLKQYALDYIKTH
jgi:uncharacterized protein (TIGR01244 family)